MVKCKQDKPQTTFAGLTSLNKSLSFFKKLRCIFVVLGMAPETSCVLDKCCTTELNAQPLYCKDSITVFLCEMTDVIK